MTMSATAMATENGGCGGVDCEEPDTWPLHHVRQRSGPPFRLCTTCVLKSHAGAFCSVCFDLVDGGSSPEILSVVRCSTCGSSVSHRTCLPNSDLASEFVCANCRGEEGFRYLREGRSDGKRKMIDVQSAKAISAAARIAANSMSRAAAWIRADADRKVKEAVMARKRAREMLERVLVRRKGENVESNGSTAWVTVPAVVVEEPRKKVGKGQSREHEKWFRINEPLADVKGVGEAEKTKGGLNVDLKSRVGNVRKEEKERKGNAAAPLSGGSVKEEKRLVGNGENGPRLPQLMQDALLSRTNPRPIFTSSASTTSLHS